MNQVFQEYNVSVVKCALLVNNDSQVTFYKGDTETIFIKPLLIS